MDNLKSSISMLITYHLTSLNIIYKYIIYVINKYLYDFFFINNTYIRLINIKRFLL